MNPETFGGDDRPDPFTALEARFQQCHDLEAFSHLLADIIDDPALLFPALTHLAEQGQVTPATFTDVRHLLFEIRDGLVFFQRMADAAIDVCPPGPDDTSHCTPASRFKLGRFAATF